MKRMTVMISFAVLLLSANVPAQENAAGFSGTWILDVEKSDLFPRPLTSLGAPASIPETQGIGGGMGGGMPGGGMRGGGMPGGMGGGWGGGMPGGMGGRGKGFPSADQNPPMIIRLDGSDLQITRTVFAEGKMMPSVSSYKCDGKEQTETFPIKDSSDPLKVVTKATCSKNKIEIRTTSVYPKGNGEVKRTFTLSKDGKTLTVKTKTFSAMQQAGRSGPSNFATQTYQDQYFNRQ